MLNAVTTEVGASIIPASRAPDGHQRVALQRRSAEIVRAAASMQPNELDECLMMMFTTMGMRGAGEQEAAMVMATYAQILRGLPAYALRAAINRFMGGDTGDGKWAPTPAELRKEALRVASAYDKEQADIRKVLDAKVVDDGPGRKGDTSNILKETINSLKSAETMGPPRAPQAATEAHEAPETGDQFRDRMAAPVRLSEEVLRKLKLPSLEVPSPSEPGGARD